MQGRESSTQQFSVDPLPHGPFLRPFGQGSGQMKAVSCNKQFPHMLQLNNIPLTNLSKRMSTLSLRGVD
jgi:hypothetical protein